MLKVAPSASTTKEVYSPKYCCGSLYTLVTKFVGGIFAIFSTPQKTTSDLEGRVSSSLSPLSDSPLESSTKPADGGNSNMPHPLDSQRILVRRRPKASPPEAKDKFEKHKNEIANLRFGQNFVYDRFGSGFGQNDNNQKLPTNEAHKPKSALPQQDSNVSVVIPSNTQKSGREDEAGEVETKIKNCQNDLNITTLMALLRCIGSLELKNETLKCPILDKIINQAKNEYANLREQWEKNLSKSESLSLIQRAHHLFSENPFPNREELEEIKVIITAIAELTVLLRDEKSRDTFFVIRKLYSRALNNNNPRR